MGEESTSSGTAFLNPDIQVCYFEQGKETLAKETTVMKVVCPEGDYVHLHGTPVYARSYLSRFSFTNQQMDMPVSQLSGGEQSRLLIAKLMLNPAHVLILDEPTNDLDVETLDVLTDCLADFEGAIILVSHDRYFLDQNSNEIWAFTEDNSGDIVKFADYNQWYDWYEELKTKKPSSSKNASENKKSANTTDPSAKKKLSAKEIFEFENIESNIAKKEIELKKLQADLISPEFSSNFKKLSELSTAVSSSETEIQTMYARWQDLEARK